MGEESFEEEPLIVPIATPLIAGPSVLATLVLLSENTPDRTIDWTVALIVAWLAASTIFLFSQTLLRILGVRGLKAIERLMGMLLISIAIQMLLNAFSSAT